MTDQAAYPEDDPRHHTARLRQMLEDVVSHAREDIGKISEPKAQALFETTAEVCTGLVTPSIITTRRLRPGGSCGGERRTAGRPTREILAPDKRSAVARSTGPAGSST